MIKVYKITFRKEDKDWLATTTEFPQASGFGSTPIKALKELEFAVRSFRKIIKEDSK